MNKVRHIFTFALLTLLFAACSEDDIIQASQTPSTGETERTETVTFTATVDYSIEETGYGAAKASTRAISGDEDDIPTRFYAQAYDETAGGTLSRIVKSTPNTEGKIVFSITGLNPNHTYTYMFWADNADGDADPTDLCRIPYTAGNIAFAATENGKPTSVNKTVDMKHAVTKVTLQTTKAVATTYSKEISLAASCASLYNVQDPASSTFPDTEANKTMTMGNSGLTANSEVLSTYIIPKPNDQGQNQTVTINAHTMTMTLDNIPLEANKHVILQGDLSTDNSKWRNAPAALVEETFYSYFFDENGNPKGHDYGGSYVFDNATTNDIISFIQSIMKVDSFDLPNNYMTERKYITSNLFVMRYIFFGTPQGDAYRFDFTFNGNTTIFYIATTSSSTYPDFSTIYPGI